MAAALARKRISRKRMYVGSFEALQFNAGQGKAGLVAMNFNLWGCGMRHLLANFTIATLVLVSGAAGATPADASSPAGAAGDWPAPAAGAAGAARH